MLEAGSLTFTNSFTETSAMFHFKQGADFDCGLLYLEDSSGGKWQLAINNSGPITIDNLRSTVYTLFVASFDADNNVAVTKPITYLHRTKTFLRNYVSGEMSFIGGAPVILSNGGQLLFSDAVRERYPSFAIGWRTDRNNGWKGGLYDPETRRERISANTTSHWLQFRVKSTGFSNRVVINNISLELRMRGMAAEASQK